MRGGYRENRGEEIRGHKSRKILSSYDIKIINKIEISYGPECYSNADLDRRDLDLTHAEGAPERKMRLGP